MNWFRNFSLLSITCFLMQSAIAQTADQVINRYIEAIGGKKKMLALNTIKMEGTFSTRQADFGMSITTVSGIGTRTNVFIPGLDTGYKIFTTTGGWNFMPVTGQKEPVAATEQEVKIAQPSLDLQSPFLNYKKKGHKVELLGKEKIGQTECYKIRITYSNGISTITFFDSKTFYRVRTISKIFVEGTEKEVETLYSNFKETPEGYTIAYTQVNSNGSFTLDKIEINKPVDPSIFSAK